MTSLILTNRSNSTKSQAIPIHVAMCIFSQTTILRLHRVLQRHIVLHYSEVNIIGQDLPAILTRLLFIMYVIDIRRGLKVDGKVEVHTYTLEITELFLSVRKVYVLFLHCVFTSLPAPAIRQNCGKWSCCVNKREATRHSSCSKTRQDKWLLQTFSRAETLKPTLSILFYWSLWFKRTNLLSMIHNIVKEPNKIG